MAVVMRPFLHLWQNNMLAHSVLAEGAGWSHAQSFFWFVRKEADITTFVYLSSPSSFTWLLSHLLSLTTTNVSIRSTNSHVHSFIHSPLIHPLT